MDIFSKEWHFGPIRAYFSSLVCTFATNKAFVPKMYAFIERVYLVNYAQFLLILDIYTSCWFNPLVAIRLSIDLLVLRYVNEQFTLQ